MQEQGTPVVSERAARAAPLQKGNVGSVYELSPMQQGMLFQSLRDPNAGVYITQQVITLGKIDVDALEAAWRDVVGHFPVFRTAFSYANRQQPYQILLRQVDFAIEHEDWRGVPEAAQAARFESYLAAKQRAGFDFNQAPLMSVGLLRLAEEKYHLVWTHHHIILDGWSLPRVYDALLTAYEARTKGRVPRLQRSEPFESFIHWLNGQDTRRAESFWRGYLSGVEEGLSPPMTRDDPEPGLAPYMRYGKCELSIPSRLHAALKNRAREARVTLNTMIQLAWAMLLSRCTGRADIVFGAVTSGRPPELPGAESIVGLLINTIPVRVRLDPWASLDSLLRALQEDNAKLRAYEHAALTDVARWSGIGNAEGLFSTILAFENYPLEAGSAASALPVLGVQGLERPHNPLTLAVVPGRDLRLHFFFDAYYYKPALIERLHGQLLRALEALAHEPSRPLASIDLLDPSERSTVLSVLHGARSAYARDCIEKRFEALAKEMSQRTALECGSVTIDYGGLNERANQLAHALIEHGVRPGDRVGLLLERSTDLVVAILGVLKAGGVYVPLDVECPAERLRFMLSQSGTALVVINGCAMRSRAAAQSLALDQINGVDTVDLADSASWSRHTHNPSVERSLEAAAYLMYTSGSTGEPKAVVATHQGVLRLVSESNYLQVSPDDVLLQLAPSSFDASTLEIWGALLNGAKLVIAPPGTLGVGELNEILSRHAVTILWLTAAYFHLVVREQVSALKGLRCLLAGGDVLNPQAVRTVLSECEGLTLINGYGPTENTTFTCCHVMKTDKDAEGSNVPIGRPISNTTIYVVDEWLNPVPAGVVGELVTGGDGVAQGYYGQSKLTAQRFVPDPFGPQPGGRLYRTGDRVRWSAQGVLEFMGRQDNQVKVRGYRIELGEIEAHLSRHEGIREAVVILRDERGVGSSTASEKTLIAYYILRNGYSPKAHDLRTYLLAHLPGYMVPSFFVALERFPITLNGKLDRNALPDATLIQHPDRDAGYVAPATEAERALVEIWEAVLKTQPIGVHDNFFELGGDSILCIQLASRACKAGYRIGIKDIFAHPTIYELARHCPESTVAVHAPQETITGEQPLLPIQRWFFEQGLRDPHHWNQSFLLEAPRELTPTTLTTLLEKLVDAHDALRLRFTQLEGEWVARYEPLDQTTFVVESHDLTSLSGTDLTDALAALGYQAKSGLDLSNGPLLRAALFDCGELGTRLLLTIHHLAVDMVSWRVILDDLQRLYRQQQLGELLSVPAKTTPFQYWGARLEDLARNSATLAELPYWTRTALADAPPIPLERSDSVARNSAQSVRVCSVDLDTDRTRDLLERVHGAYRTRIDDLLLCALARAYRSWSENDRLLIHLESHGREDLFEDVDLGRTVGWFTTLYPVLLEVTGSDLAPDLCAIKEQLRAVPGKGIGYGLLRYCARDARLLDQRAAQVSFNYLGQFDQTLDPESTFRFASESSGADMALDEQRTHLLDVLGRVQDGQLTVAFYYSENCHSHETIQRLADAYRAELEQLISHCLTPEAGGLTPSDAPLARVDADGLRRGLAQTGTEKTPWRAAAIYPASPLQAGMLLESLKHPDSGIYITQPVLTLRGPLNVPALEAAWRDVIDQFPILRTAFSWQEQQTPLQVVLKSADFALKQEDWSTLSSGRQTRRWHELTAALRHEGFALDRAPLMSVTLVRFSEEEWRLVWTHHHIILDGWSLPRVLEALLVAYAARCAGETPRLRPSEPYESYIRWVCAQDLKGAEAFWRDYLQGFEGKLPLPLVRREREIGLSPASVFGTWDVVAPATLNEALRHCARDERVTLNTFVQAAWALLLARLSRTAEAVFGIVSSGRPPQLREAESIVGLLINTVPLRVKLDPHQSVRQFLQQLHGDNVRLRSYEYVGLADIARWCGLGADGLFDSIFAFENYPLQDVVPSSASLPVAEITASEQPHNPLTLACIPGTQLAFRFFYDTYYYDERTIKQLSSHLLQALSTLLQNPDRLLGSLDLLEQQESQQLHAWNDTARAYPESNLAEVFEAYVQSNGNAIALECGSQRFSFDALNRRANQLAHTLREQGMQPGDTVGLLLERSTDLVIGLLAVLKAGGVYLPLDVESPAERLRFMLAQSRAALLLMNGASTPSLAATRSLQLNDTHGVRSLDLADPVSWSANTRNPGIERSSDAAAYLMYTSGSTGEPKAVVATHRGVLRLVSENNYLQVCPEDVFLQLAPASFDASTLEIWGALLNGARLVIAAPGTLAMGELADTLSRYKVSTLWLTTAYFHLVVREQVRALKGLRYLLTGGDVIHPQAVRTVLKECEGLTLIAAYGPTENTTFTSCHVMNTVEDAGRSSVPIGRPITNSTVHIVDEWLNPVPVGVVGELVTGGDGLAQGYYGRSALTAERFVPDPFAHQPGSRLYRTGDLARWTEAGVLEFVGRLDHQVKVRGYRIEPAEIEAHLNRCEGVEASVVLVHEQSTPDGRGAEKSLVAYYTPKTGFSPTAHELRAHLLQTLPAYMMPSFFIALDSFPITANGKLDRAALPHAALTPNPEGKTGYVLPVTETERALVELWEAVLKTVPIGIHDNFFELGGDSILSMQLVSRMEKAGFHIGIKDLFAYPTVHQLAQHCGHAPGPVRQALVPADASSATTETWDRCTSPLTYTQLDQWSMYVQTGSLWPIDAEYEIEGPLIHEHLVRAINASVSRHQAFWARITRLAPIQRFVTPHDLKVPYVDLSDRSAEEQEREIKAIVAGCRIRSLRELPLVKAGLIRTAATRHLLVFGFTHLVIDGASVVVLLQDIARAYDQLCRGENVRLPPNLQISEAARAERDRFSGTRLQSSLAFWRKALYGLRPYALPKRFFADPDAQTSVAAALLPKAKLEALQRLSAKHGATLQMSMAALVCLALRRAGGSSDVLLKVFLNGRDDVDSKVIVAPLYRELMLRIPVTEPTFSSVLSEVKSFMTAALDHQHCPWIIPVSFLQLSKWPAPLRALLPLWNACSSVLTRTVYRAGALYPRILACCAVSIELPVKKRFARLPSGETGEIVDVNINMRLHGSTDLAGFSLHGARVSPSTRARPEALDRADRAFKTLDINFERDTNGDAAIIITGGGLTGEGQQILADLLTELIDAALSEGSGLPEARRVV